MLKIEQVIYEAGNIINEDMISYNDHFAMVLDGSTGLRKKELASGENIARWYVEQFRKQITIHIEDSLSLPEIVGLCIEEINLLFEQICPGVIDKVDEPSASITMIRERDGKLEVFSLGDCTTILTHKDQSITYIYDERVAKLDNDVIEKMIDISKEKHITILQTRDAVQEQLIVNRCKKNEENGYWILGLEKEAVQHAYYQVFDLESICYIYMLSDGIAEYYEEMDLAADYKEFIKQLQKEGAQILYKRLRKQQEEDSQCNLYPRIKPKDDASLLVLTPFSKV